MHVIITTESGSRYEINDENKSWERLSIGNDQYTTRTATGKFNIRSEIVVGQPFTMLGDGLVEGIRFIQTTPVQSVVPCVENQ